MFQTAIASNIQKPQVEEYGQATKKYPKMVNSGDIDENTCEQIYADGTICTLKKAKDGVYYPFLTKKLDEVEFSKKMKEINEELSICSEDDYYIFK